MTTYNWSALGNNQRISTFDPLTDKLAFNDATISAANVSFTFSDYYSSYVIINYGGKVIVLSTIAKFLTTKNVTFANGSLLLIGDNTAGTERDDDANTLNGSAQGDYIVGAGGNDTINANDGNDTIFVGYASSVGDDTIDGGAGMDTLFYGVSSAISVNMAMHKVTSFQGVQTITQTIRNIEKVFGTSQNDIFIAGAIEHKIDALGNITNEIFRGNAGDDTITGVARNYDGGTANDIDYRTGADYSNNTSTQAIKANLSTGFVRDGLGGTDTLQYVSMVFGGAGNDTIEGGSLTRGSNGLFWEMFRGNGGDDTMDGANIDSDGNDASSDRADYSNNSSTQAIDVNMVTGKVSDGFGGTDTLIDIDQVWGGAGNDTFLGGDANETFDGGAGSDTIDGGGGSNRVSYKQSTSGVIVNVGSSSITVDTSVYAVTGMTGTRTIAAGTANDGMGGTDVLSNVNSISGSDFNDYLRGTDIVGARSLLAGYGGDNYLVGGAGIAIIEGRLGAVKVEGNERLSTDRIMGAIEAQPGAVVDVPAIERDVAWFNKSRNAQIQASLQPGANFGLTDIQLTVLEPPVNAIQVFADNMGVESVGQYEAGINYQRYGLWGNDDKLTLYGVGAQGNANLNVSYNIPFNPWGGRVGVSATKGRIKIVSGPYVPLKVDGDSMSVAANASQPLFVTSSWSLLANGALTLSKSESRETSVLITDNKSVKKTIGATVSYTGAAFTYTIAPNVSLVDTTMNVRGVRQSFMAMNAAWSGMYRLPLDLSLTSSGSFQWATKKLLTSDQLFQIGGPTTVRGYPTNGMAGYGGWYGNFELHHSLEDYLTKGLDGFVFVDQGSVFSTFPQRIDMLSVGAGVGWNTGYQGVTVDLTVALPLMRAMSAQRGLAVYGRVSAKL